MSGTGFGQVAVSCSVLQCVAVYFELCCNVSQCVAVCRGVLQRVAVYERGRLYVEALVVEHILCVAVCGELKENSTSLFRAATCCSVCCIVFCSVMQRVAVCCSVSRVLRCVAVR